MKNQLTDTIAAIATPPGAGGVGVVRISGPDAFQIAEEVFRRRDGRLVRDLGGYQAAIGEIIDPKDGQLIDEAICLCMREPRSYTGENVIELQCHGGVYLMQRVLDVVLAHGARLADRGEFTRRAFLNGRLELTQAEAVLDLIQAESETAHRLAIQQLKGSLQRPLMDITARLLGWVAQIEALIDFPEDEVEGYSRQQLLEELSQLLERLRSMAESYHQGKIARQGLPTVLLGRPNVGKSSLFNLLAGQDRAIVTDTPGTTRDVIEERIRWGKLVLVLSDTAGIRNTEDQVEKIGVERSWKAADEAQLQIILFDVTALPEEEEEHLLQQIHTEQSVFLLNKIDLGGNPDEWRRWLTNRNASPERIFDVSAKDGTGLDEVRQWLEQHFLPRLAGGYAGEGKDQPAIITHLRHRQAILEAIEHLSHAEDLILHNGPEELIAAEFRSAWSALASITGELVEDDILTQIFSRFCIGK